MTHPLSSAIIIFYQKSVNFVISRNTDRFHLDRQFLILLTFLESLSIILINMVTILMMSAKMATLSLLKKRFRKKVMTIYFLSRTSPAKFYHVIQILRIKTESQKVFGANSYVCKSYRGKTNRVENSSDNLTKSFMIHEINGCPCMIVKEIRIICIHDNLFNCRPHHQHIHLKEKK